MISSIVSRLVIIVFGTLYPAYASYKAVRTKNVKEYVKWMMYWIVFALFTCAETFTDIFFSFWFPFYYEIKVLLVLWLLSPATKGSSILYRKFVHPMLSRHEQEIDEYIAKAKEQGYHTVLHLGTKGVNYATTVIMQTAIKGGGGLVQQLRRSYSLSDLSSDMGRNCKALPECEDHADSGASADPRLLRPRGHSPRRSASGSGRVEMYFPEVDVDVRSSRETNVPLSHIRSTDDVSSGYSSAEPLYVGHHHTTKSEGLASSREPLVRTASVGSTRATRAKSSRGGATVTKRTNPASTNEGTEDSYTQEDCFELPYDFPTCPPSRHHSLPLSEQEVAQSLGINPQLLSLLRSWSNNNLLDTCDEPTILAELDPATERLKEDLCHYEEEDTFFDSVSGSDGKSDTSNKPEAVADVETKSADIENNLINTVELLQKSDSNKLADESCTFSDAFGESLVETEVCAHETQTLVKSCESFQTETVALEKCPSSDESPAIVGISNEHLQIEGREVENTKGIEFEESSESVPCQDDREEILPVAEDNCPDSNEPPVIVGIPNEQLQIEVKNVHSKDVRLEASSKYVQYQDTEVISKQSNVKGNVEHENVEEKPSQIKSGEQLDIQGVSDQQNTLSNSNKSEMDQENVVNDLEINLPDVCVELPAAQSADVKSSDKPTAILNEELKFEDCLEIVEVPLEVESCETKLKENGTVKQTELAPEGSVTTQSFSVTDADSVSESGSTRKDERSGRYNKLQAPSPPPRRVKEIKGRNGEERSSPIKDGRTSDIKDISNSGETSQKPTKRRKRNSGNSNLTRLQSQIENLASLLPFWHSRHDSLTSVQSCVGSTSHLDSLSVSSADNVPGRKLSSVSSSSEQEKLAKTPDIGEYHIREMSHSPVFGKRL